MLKLKSLWSLETPLDVEAVFGFGEYIYPKSRVWIFKPQEYQDN